MPVRLLAPAPGPRLRPFLGRDPLLFLTPDGGANPQTGTSPAPAPAPAPDPAEGLRNALQRANNDAMALAAQLYSENYQHRERIRQLAAAAPAEGSVVLSREQAAQWTAYQQLGAPDALQSTVQQAQQSQQELAGLKRQGAVQAAAAAAGFKPGVLAQLPGADALEFIVKEVEANGTKAPAAFVKGQDGAEVALASYAQQHWADFLPALAAAAPVPAGTAFPGQQPAGGQPPADPVAAAAARFQQQRDAAPSPLKPRA
jgi:hypothetical protein